jgi:hypothetical protein
MLRILSIFAVLTLFSMPASAQEAKSSMNTGQKPLAKPATATVGKPQYIRTDFRVVGQDLPQGCSYANWTCLDNLCKASLGTNAWRGDAGCWQQGANWFCHFGCSAWMETQ